MLALLDALLSRRPRSEPSKPDEPARQSRWIIDLPLIGGKRLGTFRTREDAHDARREYIIRTLKENSEPKELPL